jgi:EAL domain-containing protein (putative c-di-GMP-specific phosphodiesterase class I)/DNA-binding NarL/FixJ family response regulator
MRLPENINLLVSCESQTGLEAVLGLFREAGHTTRAHRVSSLRDLGELLRDAQWDVLIADDRHPELTPAEALTLLAERDSDLPCLVCSADTRSDAALGCLRQGAREVMGHDESERLLRAALREATGLREHRELARLRVQYAETARRAELLLAASQDAIAYVVDGMHVQANALYASLYGFAGAEELTSVPLIDLIAGSRQKDFKAALKRYGKHPEEQTSIDFTGLRTDASEFAGQLVLSTAHFEGEPCMQVLVRASTPAVIGNAGPGGIEALLGALSGQESGFILLVGIDGYALHCRTLGVNAANRLIEGLGALVQSSNGLASAPLRIGDAVLAVTGPALDRSQAIDLASQIILQVSERVHAVGSQSVSCTACAVALPLELVARDGAQTAVDRGWSALAAVMERAMSLRGSDPERVQLIAAPGAAAASSGTSLAPEIREGGFRILFQPIVSLRGDSTEHYEVQVRRTQDNQCANDWLAAAGLAEASLELDKWVFIEVLKKLALQLERHPQTRLLVPIGVQALRDPEFAQWLALALHGASLSAETLVVRVSHPDVAANLGEARHLAERVHALGAQLCVSEVHSANNPVADLIHLKPQLARLDGAMAAALKDADSTNTLLKPLVEAMHHEQIASIMPEVESAGMLAVLWQVGVNYIQGSYLQPPQPDMRYDFTDLA